MIEVYPRLWVGNKADHCDALDRGMHIVHATKSCHQDFLGYTGSLHVHDFNYLLAVGESDRDLYLNLVDAVFSPCRALVEAAIGWLTTKHWLMGESVLIHCDQGHSRAPSLALLYLHRRMGESWESFQEKYPQFLPGSGMIGMFGPELGLLSQSTQ